MRRILALLDPEREPQPAVAAAEKIAQRFGAEVLQAVDFEAIERLSPDLVVSFSAWQSPLQRTLFRADDWRLIRECRVPVLLVKDPTLLSRPRILACVDPTHAGDKPAALDHQLLAEAERFAHAIARGRLGRVAAASVSVRWWRPQKGYYDQPGRGTYARDGGGVLITQAIHTLDLFLSLAGPVAQVSAFAGTTSLHRMEAEDIACAALRFANGAIGSLDATSAAYPGFPERIEIVGEKGTGVILGDALEMHFHDGQVERVAGGGGTGGGADPMAFSHDAHLALIRDFVDAVEQRRAPRISGREALGVHRLFTAVLRSAKEGRIVDVGGGG